MMQGMMSSWMMGGIAVFGFAILLLIILSIAALLKYLLT